MRLYSKFFSTILFSLLSQLTIQSQELTPVDITIDRDGTLLNGKLYVSEGNGIFPTVLLLHGFPGNETDVLGLGNSLSKLGINVLTVNYSGTYQSQGEFSFKNTQKDIQAAYEFIHQPENTRKYKLDTTCIHLGGLSYGGGMALTYAANHPEINSVFSIAGTDHGEFIREYTTNPSLQEWFDNLINSLGAPEGPVRIEDGFSLNEIVEIGIDNYLSTLDLRICAPLLAHKHIMLIGGWDDINISLEHHLLPLYRALRNENAQKVKITAVQDNHSFRDTRVELTQIIAEWIKTIHDRFSDDAL